MNSLWCPYLVWIRVRVRLGAVQRQGGRTERHSPIVAWSMGFKEVAGGGTEEMSRCLRTEKILE